MQRLSLIPYIGGKHYVIPKLIELMPKHTTYVELFGGSAKLLLNKKPSTVEVYNDLDNYLFFIFKAVSDRDIYKRIYKYFKNSIISRSLYLYHKNLIKNHFPKDIVNEYVKLKQENPDFIAELAFAIIYNIKYSFKKTPNITKGHFGYNVSNTGGIDIPFTIQLKRLYLIHKRLSRVIIECDDYKKIIDRYDTPNTFFFVDPPYIGLDYYNHNFTLEQHLEMLDKLKKVKGKVLIIHNDNEVYDNHLLNNGHFKKFTFENLKFSKVKNRIISEKKYSKYKEAIYINYDLDKQLEKHEKGLFQ